MIKHWIVFKILKAIGIPEEALKYVKALTRASRDTAKVVPKVLVDLNVMNLLRGIYTRLTLATNLDWVLPYWIEQQYDYSSKNFVARGFQFSTLNVGHRNWTSVGALDGVHEAIVDERGLVMPYYNSWSLDFWMRTGGKLYAPSQLSNVRQKLVNGLPIVETSFVEEEISVTATSLVELIEGEEVLFERVSVRNTGAEARECSFYYSVRPYNVDGLALINKVYFDRRNVFHVNDHTAVKLMQKPDNVLCSDNSIGDVALFLDSDQVKKTKAECPIGLCSGAAEYRMRLNPGEERTFEARMPVGASRVLHPGHQNKYPFENVQKQFVQEWEKKLAKGMQVSLPDQRVQEAFDANKAYMLLFYDGDSINPGPFNYHSFWFRDAAYLLNSLDKIGYPQEARRVLTTFPRRQHPNGFFHSQENEWDSNGEAIWTLVEHYRMTRDSSYLQIVYPSIKKGAFWIVNKLAETRKPSIPHYLKGLLPSGLSAEHFGQHDYYLWDDFWALAGLRDAAKAAWEMNDQEAQRIFDETYEQLMIDVNKALTEAERRLKRPLMPISPHRRMDSAAVGCLSSVYPTRLFSPYDERVINTIEELRDISFNGNGFFHDVTHSGYGTYLTTHFINCYTYARSLKAVPILDWLLAVATPTFTWPESINPITLGGCVGDGHHGWAAADFLVTVRNMLFFEEEGRLVLFPAAPQRWFSESRMIDVKNAPSYFGRLSFGAKKYQDRIEIHLDSVYASKPSVIEINIPFDVKSFIVDGMTVEPADNRIEVAVGTRQIVAIIR